VGGLPLYMCIPGTGNGNLCVRCMGTRILYVYVYMYISHRDSRGTPGVFHAYLYNHARRLRLEKLLYPEVSRSPNGFLNRFWIQVAVSLPKPPHGGFRSETAVT
jgi:hypothetical protein